MTSDAPQPGQNIDAVVFDTDGVIARSATLHAAAWKTTFDAFLEARDDDRPFSDDDYRLRVDGRARHDGVAGFLSSRGMELPWGTPDDPADHDTVHGLGRRKDECFRRLVDEVGVEAYESTLELIRCLREAGVRTASVSASENAGAVIRSIGADDLFDAQVDGVDAARLGLPGKPDPALFLEAADRLGVAPARTAVVEDALAGVEAGRRGGFGLVIGVDRTGHPDDLVARGADLVVDDLALIHVDAHGHWTVPQGCTTPADRRRRPRHWYLEYRQDGPAGRRETGLREALCTVGNGYLATRGAAPERSHDEVHHPGTYIAGVYNRLVTVIADRPVENESLVNAPNWLPFSVRAQGGPWLGEPGTTVVTERLELDLFRGVLTRWVRYRDLEDRLFDLTQQRFVSMRDAHLAVLETTVQAVNWAGVLEIRSGLDAGVRNDGVARYANLDDRHLTGVRTGAPAEGIVTVVAETTQSRVRIAQAARTRVTAGATPLTRRVVEDGDRVDEHLTVRANAGRDVVVEKVVATVTSHDTGITEPATDAVDWVTNLAGDAATLLARHETSWRHVWGRARIELGTDGDIARLLHLHQFHLLQTVSNHTVDRDVGVPARGLHGEAYRGHIFWDEIFIFPFLSLRFPQLARALLLYRYRRLPQARQAALAAGFRGAMYPWQSGSNGREETQTLHLNPLSGRWLPDASQRQRHVNAAIVVNVWQYVQATGDIEFLRFFGAEMVLEIARFWSSIATFDDDLGRYEIKGVMGPDEFHERYPGSEQPGLDNNSYTNLMAVWCIRRAFDVLDLLPPVSVRELKERLRITEDEFDRWDDISRRMRVCFHDGVLSQFEGYEELEELDWTDYRERYGNIERLDRILESEGDTCDRYRLSKQADVTMLFYVLSAGELKELLERLGYPYDRELIPRTIAYYDRRTSHGSTLSRLVDAWTHARIDRSTSWQLFVQALRSDVDDTQGGTTAEGIHLGAMAGTVDMLQRCYSGLETRDGILRLHPRLPDELGSLSFDVRYRGHLVSVALTTTTARVHVDAAEGAPIEVEIDGKASTVAPGGCVEVTLPPPG